MLQETTAPATGAIPQDALHLIRDRHLSCMVRALLLGEVTRLRAGIAPKYWTYSLDGDEVLASDEDIALVERVLTKAAGCKVSFTPGVKPGLAGEEYLKMREPARSCVFRELFALLANVSAADLAMIPPADAGYAGITSAEVQA